MLLSLRPLLIPVALVGLVWLCAGLWLGRGDKVVDGADLMLWFVALPALAVSVWLAASFAFGRRPASGAPGAAPAAPAPTPAPVAAAGPLAVVFAALRSAAGDDAPTALSALQDQTPCLAPDPAMLGHDGLPLMTGRVADLDTVTAKEWVLSRPGAAMPGSAASEALLRIVALADPVIDSAVDAVLAASPIPEAGDTVLPGAVRLCVIAPEAAASLLAERFRHKLETGTGRTMPLTIVPAPRQDETGCYDAFAAVAAFARDHGEANDAGTLVLIGCDSLIHEDGASQLTRLRPPASRANSPVRLGEIASAVVLAPLQATGPEPQATLHPPARARRETAACAGGKVSAEAASEALGAALAHAGTPSPPACGVVSDIDLRSPWVVEHALAMSAHLPHLDPVADHVAMAAALGVPGDDGGLGVIALAATWTQQAQAPVIATAMAGPLIRQAALISPGRTAASTSLQQPT